MPDCKDNVLQGLHLALSYSACLSVTGMLINSLEDGHFGDLHQQDRNSKHSLWAWRYNMKCYENETNSTSYENKKVV